MPPKKKKKAAPKAPGRRREDSLYKTQISRLIEIGIALSAELKLDALLEKIVYYTRELTNADAGTLYLLSKNKLHFKILQTESMNTFQGGTTEQKITLPPVPLGKRNVSAYSAVQGETVKIDDVYEAEEFDFSGTRKYDQTTGYRSQSMLVVPMKNHEGQVIGVLQLLNALDPKTKKVTTFADDVVDLTEALASQAAVAITNAALIEETKALFEALIRVLAVAVQAKDPTTGNHVLRVAEFNLKLAKTISAKKAGPFKDIHFTESELEECRLAGWLHDVGKLVTPDWVVNKSTKLEAVFDRVELVKTRFQLIKKNIMVNALKKRENLSAGQDDPEKLKELDERTDEQLARITDELEFLVKSNQGGEFMEAEKLQRLQDIARETYVDDSGEQVPFVNENEVYNLSIKKGTLTDEERKIINDHVVNTARILAEVPFTERLQHVPDYASQHHEKLNGKGYPHGLPADKIPLQSRILAVADVYEALSAKDRPYKKPMPEEKVLQILGFMVKDGELDPDVVDLLVKENIHQKFEAEYEAHKPTEKKNQ